MTWTLQMYKPSSECKLKPPPPPPHTHTQILTQDHIIWDTSLQRICYLSCKWPSPFFLPEQHISHKHQIERQNLSCAPKPPSACTKEGEGEVWYQGRREGGPVPREGRGRSGTKGGEREVWDQMHMMEYHIGGHMKCTNKSSSEYIGRIRQNYIQRT